MLDFELFLLGKEVERLSEEQGVRSTQASGCAKLCRDIDACPRRVEMIIERATV